ncbi:MAG: DNA gyrase subunit A [Clostridiales bacterium]|nr:DNA gyrase subunit A [Clostridiales bacterium]
MDNANHEYNYQDQKIIEKKIEGEVKSSFISYAVSVLTSRALPDVRDGLKPVHRRILYAMYEDHLTYDNPFRKSATTVGNVLGRYHPHGDTAVYDAMVRLAQSFSLRYPLIDGHGNFGNVDGDGAAAYRYTEARMAKLANEMLADIEKEVVPFAPNFDYTRKEPEVLPSRYPNLLVNGSMGIAVGMATNIPPHNLGEVIDGTIYLMDHPEAGVPELMQFIKGPDFPTKATIYGTEGIRQAYATGRGKVMVRARAEIDEDKHRIVVTEIPYQVNKSMLVTSIAELHKDKRVDGITALRDESDRRGMKIVIEYRRDINGQILLNQLYKYTQLQDTCGMNMVALVDGEPKVLGLVEILNRYIAHQETVIVNRTKFDLRKAEARAHILEGLLIAIDNIDEVIRIIRASQSIPDAKAKLMENFPLDEIQAQAIVDMTLGKLSGLETHKIEDELNKLHALIDTLRGILSDENKVKDIIKEEMLEIKRKFNDDRQTEILESQEEIDLEDLIEKHECVITLSHDGYIKRQPAASYTAQNRGGMGIRAAGMKEEDYIEKVEIVNSHAYLLMFTNLGKIYTKKAYMIPEGSRIAKGSNIVNLIELAEGEKVTAMIAVDEFSSDRYLTMITRGGVIKRTCLQEYEYQRKGGKIAINLDEGDELAFVFNTAGDRDVMIATRQGFANRFYEGDVRTSGRVSRGVRGIKLTPDDYVTGATLTEEGKTLLTLTENGFGKRTAFENFKTKNRGGKGVHCQKITEKTGPLVGIAAVAEEEDLMIVTAEGVIIRTPAAGINLYSKDAVGVIIMRMKDQNKIVNYSTVSQGDDEKAEDAVGEEPAPVAEEAASQENE